MQYLNAILEDNQSHMFWGIEVGKGSSKCYSLHGPISWYLLEAASLYVYAFKYSASNV